MFAVSRGHTRRLFDSFLLLKPMRCTRTRCLHNSPLLFSAKKVSSLLKDGKKIPTKTSSPASSLRTGSSRNRQILNDLPTSLSSTYQTYESVLAKKTYPTLLYIAPSSIVYHVTSYTAATFCFSYGILSYWNNYLCAPPDIAIWIPYAFGGVSLAMILFGIRFLRNPLRIIRSITAVPGLVDHKPILQIEILLKKSFPIPFLPARVLIVKPHEICIPTPLVSRVSAEISQSELRRQKLEEQLRKQRELEYERSHIMSAGIRHMSRALSKGCFCIFRATQRSFTQSNFLEIKIRGKIYKLDLEGGWGLDGGRAIERLVNLEPNSNSSLVSKLIR
ncbi:Bgt-266 [Blumeria graminis f. sp. tritici]|uniref:Bgt-266 n=3 Tax=Blumeria graminis f. sp. tritici TaxID=62690 RepID=A0A9X9PSH7_BLUGR|nr:Bgt-266 [Blumeria graminis f. sp. tritici]